MMGNTLFFFPDTNLFVQCKPLQEIDWSVWGDFDEIRLVVSRPVQAEIDGQKGKGSGRLAKRARATSSLFRDAILAESGFLEIRAQNPAVRLYLRLDLKTDPTLAAQLNYDERDDQLVGIAAFFAKNNPDADVRILTHDTGPMASAKMVGVVFGEIPEAWLLAPEADEVEKRVNVLQSELARYKKMEPSFDIRFENLGGDTAVIELEVVFYSPLDNAQVSTLLNSIKTRFPEATDFGPSEPQERQSNGAVDIFKLCEVFTPASAEEIAKYQNEHYPGWLCECESQLRNVHDELTTGRPWPVVSVRLRNTGSRPAEDALITFSANGSFKVLPKSLDNKEKPAETDLSFPRPPAAPKGNWSKKDPLAEFNTLATARDFLATHDFTPFPHQSLYSGKRDPNDFYWKPSRPKLPVTAFSLECQQWRHLIPDGIFDITIHVEPTPCVITGAIEVVVHAANMTDAFVDRKAVRISVLQADAFPKATALVQQLLDGTVGSKIKFKRRTDSE